MADTAPQPAAVETEKPVAQSKDASMGYPVALATPADAPAAIPDKRPKVWLYSGAITLALVGIIGQAILMNSKLTIDLSSDYRGYYDPLATTPTTYDPPSYSYPTYYNPATGRRLSSAMPQPPATTRKLLGSKKSKTKKPKYRGGGGGGYDGLSGYTWVIKGKQLAKAPGMVIAAATIALVAAIAFLVFLLVPRLHFLATSQWAVIAEAALAPIVLLLWLVAMGTSAKTASVVSKDFWKNEGPAGWRAGNAIALTCCILSLFVWGAILAFAVKQLLALLRNRREGAPAAAAAPYAAAAQPQPAEASMAHNPAYAAGGPAPLYATYPDHATYLAGGPPAPEGVYPAPPTAGAPAAYQSGYPPQQYTAHPAVPAGAPAGYPADYPSTGPYAGQPAAPVGVYPPPQHGA